MPYQSIIYDLDGTLCDSSEGILESYRFALETIGWNGKIHLLEFIGLPLVEAFDFLGHREKSMAIDAFRSYYAEKGMAQSKLYPMVREHLEMVRKRGYQCFILTAKPTLFTERVLALHGIADLFTAVSGVSLGEEVKSKKERLVQLIRDFHVDVQNSFLIGDRRPDAEAAAHVGLPFIAAAYGYGKVDEFAGLKVYRSIRSVAELKGMF